MTVLMWLLIAFAVCVAVALLSIERRFGGLMAGIDDLRTAVSSLQDEVTAEGTAVSSLVAAVGSMESQLVTATDQITQLQNELAAGNVVTDSDLEDVATTINSVSAQAAAAVDAANAALAQPTPASGESATASAQEAQQSATVQVPGAVSQPQQDAGEGLERPAGEF